MRRRDLIVILLYALFILGLIFRSREALAFMIPLLIYLGTGLLYKSEKIQLRASRTFSTDRVVIDTPVTVRLEVLNEGQRLEEVLLEDFLPASLKPIKGSTSLLMYIESGETLNWEYVVQPDRGHHGFQGIGVSANDYFGLFQKQVNIAFEDRLTVLPDFIKLKQFKIRPRRTKSYPGIIPSRSGGQGIDFFGVREHQEGDPPRLINWKATARHPRIFFTNEFEQERIADVGLVLDVRRQCYGIQESRLFEYAVTAAATLADSLLSTGNRVGLFIFGGYLDWTFPGYGKVQKERILQALAKAKRSNHAYFERLEHLPTRLFPSNSLLILISPLLRKDRPALFQLMARGYQVLVMSPDPISFEKEYVKSDPDFELGSRIASLERTLMLRELQQAGVQVLNLPLNMPFHYLTDSSVNWRVSWHR